VRERFRLAVHKTNFNGEDALYYGTKHSGASNDKAKRTFNFKPRCLQ
jgi:hypothetical protein